MHLGYHELRNMLSKFKEERDKRKQSGPAPGAPPTGMTPGGTPARGDYRSSRDDYRERDKGYERHGSSRYE